MLHVGSTRGLEMVHTSWAGLLAGVCFSPDAILYSFVDMLRHSLQDSYQQDCWLFIRVRVATAIQYGSVQSADQQQHRKHNFKHAASIPMRLVLHCQRSMAAALCSLLSCQTASALLLPAAAAAAAASVTSFHAFPVVVCAASFLHGHVG